MIEWISQQLLQEQSKIYCSDNDEEEKARDDYGSEDDGTASNPIVIPTLKRSSYVLKRKTLRAKFKKPKRNVRFAHQHAIVAVESRHNADDTCSRRQRHRQRQALH